MNRPILWLWLFIAVLPGRHPSLAADARAPKPLAVVSLAAWAELESDIAYIAKLADNPALAIDFDAAINRATNGAGLAGLDKSRPWGAVIQLDEAGPTTWLFLPVTAPRQFLAAVEPQLGRPKQFGDNLWEFSLGPQGTPVYLLARDNWVFLSQRRSVLLAAPANPATMLGTLPKQYDLALCLMPGNMSAAQLNAFVAQLGQALEGWLQQGTEEADVPMAIRRQGARRMLQLLAALAADLEQVVLGVAVDSALARAYLDVVLTARPASAAARQFAELRSSKTNFAGFRSSGAALSGTFSGRLPEAKAAMLADLLDDIRIILLREVQYGQLAESQRAEARKAIEQLMAVLQRTVKQRQIDGGITGVLGPEGATLVLGVELSEAERLEDVVKFLAGDFRRRRSQAADWIKLHAEQYQRVNFHTLKVPIPPEAADRQRLVALFGEKLEAIVGIAPQTVYLGVGREALQTLKQAIDRSADQQGKAVPPVEVSLSLRPVAETVAVLGRPEHRPLARLIAAELGNTSAPDRISLLVTPTAFGVRYRVEAEQGVLRLAAKMMSLPAPKGN